MEIGGIRYNLSQSHGVVVTTGGYQFPVIINKSQQENFSFLEVEHS